MESYRDWMPEACTLPTVDQPLRLAEFDALFAAKLIDQRRVAPDQLEWTLAADAEPAARDLAAREAACCSFFSFGFAPAPEGRADVVTVTVTVSASHQAVLAGLALRADSLRHGNSLEVTP